MKISILIFKFYFSKADTESHQENSPNVKRFIIINVIKKSIKIIPSLLLINFFLEMRLK